MATPRLEINLSKIAHNLKILKNFYGARGISISAVTKSVSGDIDIARLFIKQGIKTLADARIDNLKKMKNAGIKCQFLLLGPPMLSEVEAVVRYADISLNTEIDIIKQLAESAVRQGRLHKVVLMVELGDLREGIMPSDLNDYVSQVIKLEGIELLGIGANLACFGGIKPDHEKMEFLSEIACEIEKTFNIHLEIISGGNSANYEWFTDNTEIGRINGLRLGESIFLGVETLHRKPILDLFTDAFTLVAEVVELKIKPSLPFGKIAQNAFGQTPVFKDNGNQIRAILGIGLQDIPFDGLEPKSNISILGGASNHMVINPKRSQLRLGSLVRFNVNYAALVAAMTSPFVIKQKIFIEERGRLLRDDRSKRHLSQKA
ncbi:MAG: alanine/ornithine racemase family PLP-dependent enzyme [Cyclobacteriaceae bacterium]